MTLSNIVYYIQYFVIFILAQSVSMWGQYFTLKFPNMTMVESFMKAIPFAWLDWFLMTIAVDLGEKHKLVTPTQDTFLLIIIQFVLVLLINHFYLKQIISRSDIIAFFLILFGFAVSFNKLASKFLEKKDTTKQESKKDTTKQ
uniref:Uncharacterized protein n=1 Tax=viral metagenome TaxID=1070528 RepID=A0A6C0KGX4_9ZZZZ